MIRISYRVLLNLLLQNATLRTHTYMHSQSPFVSYIYISSLELLFDRHVNVTCILKIFTHESPTLLASYFANSTFTDLFPHSLNTVAFKFWRRIIITIVIFVCGKEKYCLCRLCRGQRNGLTRIGRQLNASTINFQPQEYRRFSGNTREATGPL